MTGYNNRIKNFGASPHSGSLVVGPEIWVSDPGPNKYPKGWQVFLDPFAMTQMLGPKWLDENTVTNG